MTDLERVTAERDFWMRESEFWRKECDHWRANHDNQVRRARVLTQRPDLPVERLKCYEDYRVLQQTVEDLRGVRQKLEHIRSELAEAKVMTEIFLKW